MTLSENDFDLTMTAIADHGDRLAEKAYRVAELASPAVRNNTEALRALVRRSFAVFATAAYEAERPTSDLLERVTEEMTEDEIRTAVRAHLLAHA